MSTLSTSSPNLYATKPARYHPWQKGTYDVAPNLKRLGTDFGNGKCDGFTFQIDEEYPIYIANKLHCYQTRKNLHVGTFNLNPNIQKEILRWMVNQFAQEHPEMPRFECNTLDEFALTIQEDFVIVSLDGNSDFVSYLNVCAPSHWDPIEKLGHSFFSIHTVVPHFEKVNQVAPAMIEAMLNRSPFVRFVYGLQSDARLNHHPQPDYGMDRHTWLGQDFEKDVFVRTERQVIWGFPELKAILFLIRVHQVPIRDISADPVSFDALRSSIASMDDQTRLYKGIHCTWEAFLAQHDAKH